MKYDALVVGYVSTDIIFSKIPRLPNPGEEVYCESFEFTCGAAYNTAVAMARLGMKVALLSPIGNDYFSNFVIDKLKNEGVVTDLLMKVNRPLRLLSVALNYGGDRSFISYQDEVKDLNLEEYVNSIINEIEAKVIHMWAGPDNLSTIKIAKSRGIKVSLDIGWHDDWIYSPELKTIIKYGDLFTPNLKEALTITGTGSPKEAMEVLGQELDIVIMKLGEDGALLSQGGILDEIPGFPRKAVDTTGAGDVFSAGLLTGLIKGYDLRESVRLGNFCGGYSVEGLGGTATSPYWNKVKNEFF